MKQTLFLILGFLGLWSQTVLAQSETSPVKVVPISSVTRNSIFQNPLIDYQGRWAIVRTPAYSQTRNNLFLVQLPGFTGRKTLTSLSKYGKVWHFQEGEFALISFKNAQARDELSHTLHRVGGSCGALRFVSGQPLPTRRLKPGMSLFSGRQRALVANSVSNVAADVETDNIKRGINELQNWKSRHHSDSEGVLAGDKLAAIYRRMIPQDRKDVTVDVFNHRNTKQKSVIVRILGRTRPQELIIIGSHLDSINPSTRSTFAPGADDNASGTSGNLEIFRVLMANKIGFDRTVEIHAYAAEEIGLVGSGEIANLYASKQIKVAGMIQFDMTAFSSRPVDYITLVDNQTDPTLNKQLAQIAQTHLKLKVKFKPLHFGTSDHASWARQGYPTAFPTEDPDLFNQKLHTSDDTLQGLNAFDQATALTRLGLAYALEVGGMKTLR